MFRSGLSFLFSLGFRCLFLCEGTVFPPSNGTNVTLVPGSTEKIVWSFDDVINELSTRTWAFTPSDGGMKVGLAKIDGKSDVPKLTTLYEVAVEKPATLVLKNVDRTYNGTYEFSLTPGGSTSEIVVYIAVKPNATTSHSSFTVNEGDDVSCACRGQGGNPPADVTWYKDSHKIGETEKEEKTLTLSNVTNKKHNGTYKCVAKSHPSEMFQDDVIVEVTVNYKPIKTKIEVPEEAYLGEKLVINCSSEGFPVPNFTITHNVTTNIVSNQSRYNKDKVDHSDAGLYKCIAKNILGNDIDSGKLIVKEKRPSTKSTPKNPTAQSTPGKTTVRTRDDGGGSSGDGLSTGAIAGICVPVLLVVIVIVVYCCYKKKEKDGRNRGNIDTLPPGYAAVDKENRQGNTLYASVDTDALKPKRDSKKEPPDRAPQTDYASIDFAKTAANAAKAEPV